MRILIADDEPISRKVLEKTLVNWGHEVVAACDGTDAWQVLQTDVAPKLAIIDWMMPGMEGAEICRRIRAKGNDPYTYVLMLTSKREQIDVVAGLQSGADDYLCKPFDPQELKVRVNTGSRILQLMDELVTARDQLHTMATHDLLTGILNRAGIIARLEREMDRSRRDGTALSLVLLDIDHFKSINDRYGHRRGDEALRAVAQEMRRSVRTYDSVGRYGGEEFLLVLPGCNEFNAAGHAERFRATLEQIRLAPPHEDVRISASFGVVAIRNEAFAGPEAWIEAADTALYQAKRLGRNRVEIGKLAGQCEHHSAMSTS